MEFKTKQELYKYLNNFNFNDKKETNIDSVYFLIEFNNHIEPIYFMHYQNSWFESPCELHKFPLNDEDLMDYVKELYEEEYIEESYEHEKIFQRDNWHYDIDVPQCLPFLPDNIKIIDILSERECLDWILENNKEN